ncbi:V-type ATPase subunit subunit G family protein [Meiothermus granaticius]|uniref:Vacuolar (H+)-ATPase G subunit n=1 Tax=Meiothermus granaticius NBRC 107808 TaxID=1227551 RepID=A0A399FBL9_9DEIN|nr:V-type ATPase subunit subunit G family protein [Meiothermus granaticius]RIH93608.1 Vacuolar (H+)-ATPase G subunit [Meiothermus granaticius NBRC 107808]GEM87245.1 ATP synthase subunit C [Meiothermus granaticius NBRC 107808]
MAGSGLIKSLAERESALTQQLEDARRAAENTVREAEAKAAAIAAETEAALREMEAQSRARTAEAVARIEAESKAKAEAEGASIRTAATSKIAGAVQEVLKEVLP